MKTYYKVTRSNLCSTVVTGKIGVHYKQNVFVESPIEGTGLLVFDSLQSVVKSFVFLETPVFANVYKVFKCECEEELELPETAASTFNLNIQKIIDLWNRKENYSQEWGTMRWPDGTRAFRRVKLTEEITRKRVIEIQEKSKKSMYNSLYNRPK